MGDRLEMKRRLLAAELERSFGETCPALAAGWESAIADQAPRVLRELAVLLQEFEAATEEANRQLRTVGIELFQDDRQPEEQPERQAQEQNEEQAEQMSSRALASLERLNDIAKAITKHLDEVSSAR